jgi:hypothetical protein
MIGRGNRSTRRKTCPSAALSTTDPTCCPYANPGSRGGKPASNRWATVPPNLMLLRWHILEINWTTRYEKLTINARTAFFCTAAFGMICGDPVIACCVCSTNFRIKFLLFLFKYIVRQVVRKCSSTMLCCSVRFLVSDGVSSFYIRPRLYIMTNENTVVTNHGVWSVYTFLEILLPELGHAIA